MNVLISLHKGYGLGDSIQISAVLRHVVVARPHWQIDYCAEEGKHQVGRGIVANTFAYGQPQPSAHYDAEIQLLLFDTWANWGDRPNTRVSSCLHERFGLPWVPEHGRYQVATSGGAIGQARQLSALYLSGSNRSVRSRAVAVHYQGDSSQDKKNLTHQQAEQVCQAIKGLGRVPLLLDFRGRSPLTEAKATNREWGADAEMVCAVISQCEAFVGIDSGPSKCASATDTPALVTWTGHHPACFHDPAPNTTHLVPVGYHGLEPVCNDAGVIKWFEQNYLVRQYERDPVSEIKNWLIEVLR